MQQTDKHPSSTYLLRCSSRIQETSFHFNSHNVANGKSRRTEWYVVLQIFEYVYVFIHYSHCMSYVENWIYFSTCINFISHCSWQSILLARYTLYVLARFILSRFFPVAIVVAGIWLLFSGSAADVAAIFAIVYTCICMSSFILLHLCHFSHSYLIHYAFELRSAAFFVQSFLPKMVHVTLTLLLHEIQSE